MLGQLGMLEEEHMVVGARSRDRIPHTRERPVQVIRLDFDLERADFVRFADLRTGKDRGELRPRLEVSRRAAMQQQHLDRVSLHIASYQGPLLMVGHPSSQPKRPSIR